MLRGGGDNITLSNPTFIGYFFQQVTFTNGGAGSKFFDGALNQGLTIGKTYHIDLLIYANFSSTNTYNAALELYDELCIEKNEDYSITVRNSTNNGGRYYDINYIYCNRFCLYDNTICV